MEFLIKLKALQQDQYFFKNASILEHYKFKLGQHHTKIYQLIDLLQIK